MNIFLDLNYSGTNLICHYGQANVKTNRMTVQCDVNP